MPKQEQNKKNTKRTNQKEDKHTMKAFSIATFLNDMGSDMINPIWPMFLTSFLGINMSLLGLIDGLGDAIVSISQAISGYYSDRLKKRKIFIWTGYFFSGIARLGYAISTTWPMIIPFRIIDRAGKIRGSPRDAMVADISTDKNRGKNFGLLRTMDNFGAVAGILLCLFFINILALDMMTILLIASIPSIIGAAAIIFLIKEKKLDKLKLFKGLQFKNLNKNFKLFVAISAVFALGSFSYSFLLLFAKYLGWNITTVPILYLIFTLAAALLSLPFGKLSDKIGRKKVMYISLALWALSCILFITLSAWWVIVIIFILYGLHKAALEPVQKTFVAELAPEKFRASALGGFQMVIGLCALPASVIAGLLWDNINPTAPFVLSLGLTILAFVLLFFVQETKPY
jgi:MFS family permease